MELTEEVLKKAIREKHITRWTPERCPTCDYPIHFMFAAVKEHVDVVHDAGCNCSDVETLRTKYLPSSMKDVLATLNRLEGEDKEKAIKFWTI
jgi:PP-loop superfamily ATP-utilizing enzyme